MADVDMDKLEVERIVNLTQGFGWEKVNEQIKILLAPRRCAWPDCNDFAEHDFNYCDFHEHKYEDLEDDIIYHD